VVHALYLLELPDAREHELNDLLQLVVLLHDAVVVGLADADLLVLAGGGRRRRPAVHALELALEPLDLAVLVLEPGLVLAQGVVDLVQALLEVGVVLL
jgi:hypothetical protein